MSSAQQTTKSGASQKQNSISQSGNAEGRHESISKLAYSLWEKAGRPPGDGKNYWLEAESQIDGGNGSKSRK